MKFFKIPKPVAKNHLRKLQKLKRSAYHPLQHHIHQKHHLAKRTLFYMKEYGSKSDAARTILKESLKVLLFAAFLSTLGGISLEYMRASLLSFLPLIILLPVLNGLVGNYGIIISSKCTTMLYTGEIKTSWLASRAVRTLLLQLGIVALLTSLVSALLAVGIAALAGAPSNPLFTLKLVAIVIIDVFLLLGILVTITVYGSTYYFKHNEDPNNFLIPITTSVADFGNMIVLSLLVWVFF